MFLSSYRSVLSALTVAGACAMAYAPVKADACGCLSPPEVTIGDYAVNQQAEQIIFEVGVDSVSAHVLIRYAGAPEEFAWIVPVPNQPGLALSESVAFPLIDDATAPRVSVSTQNLCPDPEYVCRSHASCPDDNPKFDLGDGGSTSGGGTGGVGEPPGIDVLDQQVIGSYETVTFAAADAGLAVQWLQDNGFVVNDTMTPYMQPYIDANMVFVAAKLVAGAGLDELRPLKITYQGTQPMIPLQLTAVAAEPHMTVSAFIYGEEWFQPQGKVMVPIDETRITRDNDGRTNYPMVLSRTIDEAGGDAFVAEFAGVPQLPDFSDDPSGCCDEWDSCGIGGDSLCQCPASDFDADDCAAIPGLLEGIALVETLQQTHSKLTRLTTRVSPEEMTFDPIFEATPNQPVSGKLNLKGVRSSLDACEGDIIDTAEAARIDAIEACSTVYCGEGVCMATTNGPGCACNAGFVARTFTDYDGEKSVTCVPSVSVVDLGLGINLPSACPGVDCGSGNCVDVNGFAACECNGGAAAIVSAGRDQTPQCKPIDHLTASPGAENFSTDRADISVCAPTPQSCGTYGWLEKNQNIQIQGVVCESSMPDPEDLQVPPPPVCDGGSGSGSGSGSGGSDTDSGGGTVGSGSDSSGQDVSGASASCACRATAPASPLAAVGLVLFGLVRRRR